MRRHLAQPMFFVFALVLLGGCSSLTSPPEKEIDPKPYEAPSPPRPAPTLIPAQAPVPKEEEKIAASHILVAFKGARSAPASVTRTKEQGRKRAEDALKKAKAGSDFGALAKQYSDDPGSGSRGGDLGTFAKSVMVKPFGDAAFSLKPGEISGIVETEFGFHVIKRTQ